MRKLQIFREKKPIESDKPVSKTGIPGDREKQYIHIVNEILNQVTVKSLL
jgi:hypothetical protein